MMYLCFTGPLGFTRNEKPEQKTEIVGTDRVCHIKHLVDTCIVLGASASMGPTSRYAGSRFSKVAVMGIGCGYTDDYIWGQ